ncbi:hypothetical protein D3C84_680710 [compost metagenome]
MPSALPRMNVAIRITRRTVKPRSPSLMATAMRVVLPLMNETKSPLAMKPIASVMPANTESMATRLRPIRPRHFWVCRWPGLAWGRVAEGSMGDGVLEHWSGFDPV